MERRGRLVWIIAALATAASTPALAQDKIGIPACDEFLAKYETCAASMSRPERRARLQTYADQLRTTWKAYGADKSNRAQLEQICTQVADSTRQSASMNTCTW